MPVSGHRVFSQPVPSGRSLCPRAAFVTFLFGGFKISTSFFLVPYRLGSLVLYSQKSLNTEPAEWISSDRSPSLCVASCPMQAQDSGDTEAGLGAPFSKRKNSCNFRSVLRQKLTEQIVVNRANSVFSSVQPTAGVKEKTLGSVKKERFWGNPNPLAHRLGWKMVC